MDTRTAGRMGGKIGGKSRSRRKRAAALKNLKLANAARAAKRRGRPSRQEGPVGKLNLYLARTPAEIAALYKKLTGKAMSPAGRAKLEASLKRAGGKAKLAAANKNLKRARAARAAERRGGKP